MYKTFLIRTYLRLTEKLLGLPEPINDPDVETYLAAAWMSPGFRKFSAYRISKIKETLRMVSA